MALESLYNGIKNLVKIWSKESEYAITLKLLIRGWELEQKSQNDGRIKQRGFGAKNPLRYRSREVLSKFFDEALPSTNLGGRIRRFPKPKVIMAIPPSSNDVEVVTVNAKEFVEEEADVGITSKEVLFQLIKT